MRAVMDQLPQFLQQVFEVGQVYDESGNPYPLDSSISVSEAAQLFAAVQAKSPTHSLEIGLAHGVSALAILSALAQKGQGHHHYIDPFQKTYNYTGISMIARAGLNSMGTFYERFPEEIIPNLPPIQFALIDSSHLFDLTITEFVLIDKKLDIDGVLAIHDLWMPSIQTAVRYILNNRAYEVWQEAFPGFQRISAGQYLRESAGRLFSLIPGAKQFLRSDFLKPLRAKLFGNLIFLRKLAQDDRDWRFHEPFG